MKTLESILSFNRCTRKSSVTNGLTLIELLVVIAVISLLAAISLPCLVKAKEQARIISCRAKLKNVALALQMYLPDNHDNFCEPHTIYFSQKEPFPVESEIYNPNHPWMHLNLRWCNGKLNLKRYPQYGGTLFPYINSADTLMCPDFKKIVNKHGSQDPMYIKNGDKLSNFLPWYNYTMNAHLGGKPNKKIEHLSLEKGFQVRHPGQVFVFTEESPLFDPMYQTSAMNNTYMLALTYDDMIKALKLPTVNGHYKLIKPGPEGVGPFVNIIAGYHNASPDSITEGVGNCVFMDGHVNSHSPMDTFQLAWPY